MNAYIITITEKNNLEDQNYGRSEKFNPVQDINGNWFIFEQEFNACGLGILTDFTPLPNEII